MRPAYRRLRNKVFSDDFIVQLEALKAAKPDVLLVDITRNGGGSEWAEQWRAC